LGLFSQELYVTLHRLLYLIMNVKLTCNPCKPVGPVAPYNKYKKKLKKNKNNLYKVGILAYIFNLLCVITTSKKASTPLTYLFPQYHKFKTISLRLSVHSCSAIGARDAAATPSKNVLSKIDLIWANFVEILAK